MAYDPTDDLNRIPAPGSSSESDADLAQIPAPTAAPEPPKQTFGDLGKRFAAGLADTFLTAPGAITESLGGSGIARRSGQELSKRITDTLSPQAQALDQNALFGEDWSVHPQWGQKIAAGVAQSAPSLIQAFALGRQLQAPLAQAGVAEKVAAGMGRIGVPAGAAKYVGQAVEALPFSAIEGAASGGQSAADVIRQVEEAPIEQLMTVPRFNELFAATNPALSPEERAAAVRAQMAVEAGRSVGAKTGLWTGAVGAVTEGGVLGPIARRLSGKGVGEGFFREAIKGGLHEAGQEAPQSAGEQYLSNVGRRDYVDPTQDPWQNVWQAGAEGGVIGFALGGGADAATYRPRPRDEQPHGAAPPGTAPVAPPGAPPVNPPVGPNAGPISRAVQVGQQSGAIPTNAIGGPVDTPGNEEVTQPPGSMGKSLLGVAPSEASSDEKTSALSAIADIAAKVPADAPLALDSPAAQAMVGAIERATAAGATQEDLLSAASGRVPPPDIQSSPKEVKAATKELDAAIDRVGKLTEKIARANAAADKARERGDEETAGNAESLAATLRDRLETARGQLESLQGAQRAGTGSGPVPGTDVGTGVLPADGRPRGGGDQSGRTDAGGSVAAAGVPAGRPAGEGAGLATAAVPPADGGGARPVVLQNRDRSSAASVAQMASIAGNPDPRRLSFSRDFGTGAPVVFANADAAAIPETQLGAEGEVVDAAGKTIPVRYAVVEAAEVVASNRADGTPNDLYADADTPGLIRAVAGNGRMAGLQEAFNRGTAAGYVEGIAADARLHGVDPEVIRGMQNPVLVRVMRSDDVTPDIGDRSNVSGISQLDPVEQARTDVARVNLDGLEFGEDGGPAVEAVRRFIRAMPDSEQSGLMDQSGAPGRQAVDRLMAAAFAKAYESDDLVRLYAQATDPEARNVISALAQAAGPMARLAGAGDLDIRPAVIEAAQSAVNASRRGVSLSKFSQQRDFDVTPEAWRVVEHFVANARSAKRMAEGLRSLAEAAYSEAQKGDVDMFGTVPKRTGSQIINEAFDGQQREGDANADAIAGRPRLDEEGAGGPGGRQDERTPANDPGQPQDADRPADGQAGDFDLVAPTREDILRQQEAAERAAQGEQTEDEAQARLDAEREAADQVGFLRPPPSGTEQRDTTGDMLGGPTADDVLAQRERERRNAPEAGGMFAAPVDEAAAQAATSPKNDTPEPTEAQKDAGNYKKGHVRIAGLDITIENEAGTHRRPEWPALPAHYGYLKRTEGADGDQVDVFVKPGAPEDFAGDVFVIDQMVGGKFDEHKVMLGYPNQPAAAKAYRDAYTKDWKGLGAIRRMTLNEFKTWLADGDTTAPAAQPAEAASATKERVPPEKKAEGEPTATQAQAEKSAKRTRPKGRIEFASPVVGPSGAKLTSYQWQWQYEESVDERGEERIRRISDWDKAEENQQTGRMIVHQFGVEMPDGTGQVVSAETAIKLLGFTDIQGKSQFKSVESAAKTLARTQMVLTGAEQESARWKADWDAVQKMTPPQPESDSQRPTPGGRGLWWSMGDASIRQITDGPLTQSTREGLVSQWRDNRMVEKGWKPGDGQRLADTVSDLKKRIKVAEKRIQAITKAASTEHDIPAFETYDDALDWVDKQAEPFASRKQFEATNLYRAAYPQIKALYDRTKARSAAAQMQTMTDAGIKVGDRVQFTVPGFLLAAGRTYTGTVIDSRGHPLVKIDGRMDFSARDGRVESRTSVAWDSRWTKAQGGSSASDLLSDATEFIGELKVSRNPAKTADEAYQRYRNNNAVAISRGDPVLDERSFRDAWEQMNDPRNDKDAGYRVEAPRAGYAVTQAKGVREAIAGVKGKNFDAKQTAALTKWISARPDSARIVANLKEHALTPWARQSLEGALTRAAIEEYVAGRKPDFDSFLNAPTAVGLRTLLEQAGADGAWQYLAREGVVGNSSKPVNSVSSSFIDCNPSKDCATFCYAAKGNFAYGASVRKSELMTWAAESDPVRLGRLMAGEYASTLEFQHQKALRLFDKGDGTDAWLPVIEELNRHVGPDGKPEPIRVQVFSKNPDFLRKVPAMNLRMLSVDKSNVEVARANPDLPVAFVYTDGSQVEFLNEIKDRIQVILPIKQGVKLLEQDKIDALPKWTKPVVCPVDDGRVKIGKNRFQRTDSGSKLTTDKGEWNCTRCDKAGGVGCFHGSTTEKAIAAFTKPVHNRSDDEVSRILDELKSISGRLAPRERAEFLGSLDSLVSAIRAGVDIGTEGTGRAGDAARTGADDGWQAIRITRRQDVEEDQKGLADYARPVLHAQEGGYQLDLPLAPRDNTVAGQSAPGRRVSNRARASAAVRLETTPDPAGVYHARTDLVAERHHTLPVDRVTTPQEAALALASVADYAVEHLHGLVTDKDGKPLALVGMFKGGLTSSSVYPDTLANEAFRIKGAANLWVTHNHPGGVADFSYADRNLIRAMANLFHDTGITLRGLFAQTYTNASQSPGAWVFTQDGQQDERGQVTPADIRAAAKSTTIPVVERVITQFDPAVAISDPKTGIAAATSIQQALGAKQPFVMFLSSQNAVVGAYPLNAAEIDVLRKGERAANLFRAVSMANAGKAIIVDPTHMIPRKDIENVGGALAAAGASTLDYLRPSSGRGLLMSEASAGTWNAPGPIFFSRRNGLPHPGNGYVAAAQRTERDVARLAAAIARTWANGPEVVVVQDMQDMRIPEAVRREDARQRSGGASGEPEGFFHGGKVYLVAGQLGSPADVVRVLAHEALGHYGLRGLYGERLGKILDQIANVRRAEVTRKAQEYGLDARTVEGRRAATEEILAEMAQKNPQMGFVKKAIAAIRQWLRELGFAIKLTDADIVAQMIVPARQWVMRGGKTGDGMPAFSRGATETRAADVTPLGFYSELSRKVEAGPGRADAANWKSFIRSQKGIKPDEIAWSGIEEFLDIAGTSPFAPDRNAVPLKDFADAAPLYVELLSDLLARPPGGVEVARQIKIPSAATAPVDPVLVKHVATNPELRSDLRKIASGNVHTLGDLGIPAQRLVVDAVRAAIHDRKVREAVVKLLPVDVVNDLIGAQGTSERLLNDVSVLENFLSIDRDSAIPGAVDVAVSSLVGSAALDVAEMVRVGVEAGRRLGANRSAVGADESRHVGRDGLLIPHQSITRKITKEAVREFLAANGVRVEETVLGGKDQQDLFREASDRLDQAAGRFFGAVREQGQATLDDGRSFFDDELGYALQDGDLSVDDLPQELRALAADWMKAQDEYEQAQSAPPPPQPKFGGYVVPGGTNYRELLLTLPEPPKKTVFTLYEGGNYFGQYASRKEAEAAKVSERRPTAMVTEIRAPEDGSVFRSGHWDQPNVLAHVRIDERTDADGKRVLFVNEIQSDWAQRGRKHGFKTADRLIDGHDYDWWSREADRLMSAKPFDRDAAMRAAENRNALAGHPDEVARAPFVEKTDAWVALALKRAIRYALDNGFDRVAIVSGEQAAKMFNLSEHVTRLYYDRDGRGYILSADGRRGEVFPRDMQYSDEELDGVVGKEIAQKIRNREGREDDENGGMILEGVDLEVGGEGMEKFYPRSDLGPVGTDKNGKPIYPIVQLVAQKVLKQIGGPALTTVQMPVPGGTGRTMEVDRGPSFGGRQTIRIADELPMAQPGFDITPAMRDTVLDQGLAMFSRRPSAGDVQRAANQAARAIRGATVKGTWRRMVNAWTDKKPLALQLLGRRQIVDVYGNLLPHLGRYSDEMQQYDADKNESAAVADELVNRWRKLADADALADLMHDATLAQFDPDIEQAGDADQQALKDRFDGLSAEAKSVYREARGAYAAHWNKVKAAIRARIERADLGENERRMMMEQFRDQFLQPIQGVYFPLARWGDYVITAKDADGQRVVVFAESLTEAQAEHARMERELTDVSKITLRREYNAARDAVSKEFVRKLFETVDETSADMAEADLLKDAINQLYLTSLPDVSWAKHGIHRKGTPGYSRDARRAFAMNMFHGGYYLSKLRHADVLQDYLRAMQEHIEAQREDAGYDSITAQQVVNEMVKRHDLVMNPDNSVIANTLTGMGFVWFLGLSPASAIVNLSQTALVAYPIMAARFGYGKAADALTRASKEAVQFRNDLRGRYGAEENAAIDRAVREGLIDITQAHDLAGVSEGRDNQLLGALSPVMRAASYLFHQAEKFNRQATFIAVYRLARQAGEGAEQAYDTARDLTYKGHFDYACVDAETECLTLDGWKRYNELREGDVAIAVDANGRAVESRVSAVNIHRGAIPVTKFQSRQFSMVLTDNHDAVVQTYNSRDRKWQAIRKVRADSLKPSQHILRAPSAAIVRTAPKYGEDFAALLGWVAAEGWYAKYRKSKVAHDVRLAQSLSHNPEYVDEIRGILDRLGGEYKEYVSEKRQMVFFVLRRSLGVRVQAAMPDKLLTAAMLRDMPAGEMGALVDAFLKGDGSNRGRGDWSVGQKDGQNLDVIQAMAVMLGMRASQSPVDKQGRGMLHLGRPEAGHRSHVRPMSKERAVVDMVWCPTTEHGTWVARRGGRVFVTGNSSNRPRVMMGPVARVLLLFKQYGQNMIYTLGRNALLWAKGDREAKRALSGILVAHGLTAGMLGLPFAPVLLGLASIIGGSDDEPWDAEVALRNYLADSFLGKTGGEMLARGVFRGFFPGDISGRVGLDSLLIRDIDLTLEPNQVWREILEAALGPVIGIGVNASRGAADLARGDLMLGIQGMLPKAIADGVKTIRYATEGVKDRTGIEVLDEVTARDLIAQTLGFSPGRVREAYDARRAVYGQQRKLGDRRDELLSAFSKSVIAQDHETRLKTLQEIQHFNQVNPTMAITSQSMLHSIQNRMRRQAEAKDGIYLPRKQRDLAELGRFANTR